MGVHMFMKIDDIKGESADSKHTDEIELQGWEWGVSQTGSSHQGHGGGTGKASVRDLTYYAVVDKSVPPILTRALTGAPFESAQLTICKAAGGDTIDYITIKMSSGIIADVSFKGKPEEEVQTVSVSLNFSGLEFDYTPQGKNGQAEPVVSMQYSINQNAS